ncbi:serine/threonine-protein kinase [Streptomyces hainanensis]|uniref:non-specific serine/threonine protein kinase n=1 Tax=Streptomyces hainanensis TaxID=402648 RepID=A0A4V2Y3I7_9ACTN|nr:serine/threonine-protein kinase [Streptomyces hainanensis]TDC76635.1 serine/threonine protein kinase [Streptomyces hainanensis]
MQSSERIGRYRLDRRLGAGAFGVVWLAHDDVLEAPVAVKVMAENWAHRLDIRERFFSEARLLRRAGSSRVVQVFDIRELPDERPYFVMEYADGGTLEDRLVDGPLPLAQSLRLTAEAARGAAALHVAGIVHRDIKPSNVLFRRSSDGEDGGQDTMLMGDLRLAKSLAQASGLTMAAGSAGYQPPEQAEPGAGIDARADVYSLGAVGYRLVTGEVPGPPGKVVRPDALRPGLHPQVRRALLRAMAPDRERRWPTAKDFADELDRLADLTADEPVAPPRRRRPPLGTTLLAAATAATVALGGVATWLAWQRADHAKGPQVVQDATGRISVEVPRRWAGQLGDGGWDSTVLGLPDGHAPGLVVADDLAEWPDLGSPANGLFVGLSEQGDVTTEVDALSHNSCEYGGSRAYRGTDWRGTVRSWSACPADSGTVTEVALVPSGGGDQPQLYVQIRQDGESDATDSVLDSLRVD